MAVKTTGAKDKEIDNSSKKKKAVESLNPKAQGSSVLQTDHSAIADAQRAHEEFMHTSIGLHGEKNSPSSKSEQTIIGNTKSGINGIDASATGSPTSPGQGNERLHANSSAPQEVSSPKMITGGMAKITDIERVACRMGKTTLYEMTTKGTDFRVGMDLLRDTAGVTSLIVIDKARQSLANGMKAEFNSKAWCMQAASGSELNRIHQLLRKTGDKTLLKSFFTLEEVKKINAMLELQGEAPIVFIKPLSNNNDLSRLRNEIAQVLEKKGYVTKSFSDSGSRSYVKNLRSLLRNNKNMSLEDIQLIKRAMNLELSRTMNKPIQHHRISNQIFGRVKRYFQQTDAGRGSMLIVNAVRNATRTLRLGKKFALHIYETVRFGAKIAYKTSLKAAVALLQTKVGQSVRATKAGVKVESGAKSAKRSLNEAQKKVSKLRQKREQFKNFRRDPFNLRARGTRLAQSIFEKPLKITGKIFKPVNVVKNLIGKTIAIVTTIASSLVSTVFAIIAILIGISLLVTVITAIVSLVISFFDFSSTEEEIRDAALDKIQECYTKQADSIASMKSRYRNVTITYEDVRDDEAYQEEEHTTDTPYTETTNSVELLAMATVYFDFDLEEAGKGKVTDYVKKLYNGSHKTTVRTNTYEVSDAEGNVYTYTDADITLTTYYFNQLFDCKLSKSVGMLTYGEVIDIPQDFGQIWTVTYYAREDNPGIPGLWPDNTAQGEIYNRWLDAGRTYDNGFAVIDGRYLVAVSQFIAMPGDYIDVYLDDGTYFPCLVADAKATTDPNAFEYGHWSESGSYEASIVEWEVDRNYVRNYGNPGSGGWWPELTGRKVAQIVNGGNQPPESQGDEVGKKIVEAAYSQLGVPYVWGGTTPNVGLDCSGLTQWCYKQAGISIGRVDSAQLAGGTIVSDPQPGDICWTPGHVAIYIGNGKMIEAMQEGVPICISNVRVTHYVRYR